MIAVEQSVQSSGRSRATKSGCHGLAVFGVAVRSYEEHGDGEDAKTLARSTGNEFFHGEFIPRTIASGNASGGPSGLRSSPALSFRTRSNEAINLTVRRHRDLSFHTANYPSVELNAIVTRQPGFRRVPAIRDKLEVRGSQRRTKGLSM